MKVIGCSKCGRKKTIRNPEGLSAVQCPCGNTMWVNPRANVSPVTEVESHDGNLSYSFDITLGYSERQVSQFDTKRKAARARGLALKSLKTKGFTLFQHPSDKYVSIAYPDARA